MTDTIRSRSVALYAPLGSFAVDRGPAAYAPALCQAIGASLTGLLFNIEANATPSADGLSLSAQEQQARDRDQANAANAAQLAFNIGFWCIIHGPRGRAALLMVIGKIADLPRKPCRILMQPRCATRLHHDIIPCRHNLAGFLLGFIMAGAHIIERPLEHDEHWCAIKPFPLRIGPRDVGAQRAKRAFTP